MEITILSFDWSSIVSIYKNSGAEVVAVRGTGTKYMRQLVNEGFNDIIAFVGKTVALISAKRKIGRVL